MENTPSRIAADILIAALQSKVLGGDEKDIADAFNTLHEVVHTAAVKDKAAHLLNPNH